MINFSMTTVNEDTYDWNLAYFLKLDDDTGDNSTTSGCDGCTQHVLKVTNKLNEAQEVHVGAHVWQDRGYGWFSSENRNCHQAIYSNPHHSVFPSDGSYWDGIFDSAQGGKWLSPITLAAGESKEYTVMLNWNREGVQKDWSLTAWGTKGDQWGIEVTHSNPDMVTDHMPDATR
jgi:hypothetical protein